MTALYTLKQWPLYLEDFCTNLGKQEESANKRPLHYSVAYNIKVLKFKVSNVMCFLFNGNMSNDVWIWNKKILMISHDCDFSWKEIMSIHQTWKALMFCAKADMQVCTYVYLLHNRLFCTLRPELNRCVEIHDRSFELTIVPLTKSFYCKNRLTPNTHVIFSSEIWKCKFQW